MLFLAFVYTAELTNWWSCFISCSTTGGKTEKTGNWKCKCSSCWIKVITAGRC